MLILKVELWEWLPSLDPLEELALSRVKLPPFAFSVLSSSQSPRDSTSASPSSSLPLPSSIVTVGVDLTGKAVGGLRGTAFGANRDVDLLTEAVTGVWE